MMEVGIDILDIDRMSKLCDNEAFLKKYFSNEEIEYLSKINNKAEVLAGYYSCKEAFLKACGIGIGRGIDLKDISIQYNELGRPYIVLTDKATTKFNELGFQKISVNISDSKSIAVAVCIVY